MKLSNSLSKQAIRRAFDRARDTYKQAATVQAEVAKICARHIPYGYYADIVEIGAGGGMLTRRVIERCTHDRYTAVDISPEMLGQVDRSILMNPNLLASDGECLDLPEGVFNLLVSSSVMQWYCTPEQSIVDNLKLLRKGGRFSLAIYVDGTYAEFAEAAHASGFGSMYPMRTAEQYIEIIETAGMTSLEYAPFSTVTHYATVADLLRSHRATGATASSGAKMPSKSAYKRFLDYFETNFRTAEGIPSTSHVLHLWGKR